MHPSVLALLFRRGLTIAGWERRARLSRGTLWRVLAGRRRGVRLDTASSLARAAGVSVSALAALLRTARAEDETRLRRWREAEAARLEALAR